MEGSEGRGTYFYNILARNDGSGIVMNHLRLRHREHIFQADDYCKKLLKNTQKALYFIVHTTVLRIRRDKTTWSNEFSMCEMPYSPFVRILIQAH